MTKTQLKKVAGMSHDGLARSIYPVHTMHDGDNVFAASTDGVDMSTDIVGALSAEVLAKAVLSAVRQAQSAGGLKASRMYMSNYTGMAYLELETGTTPKYSSIVRPFLAIFWASSIPK
ncbi:P1 family peptidase [Paenibacillus larvae]|uniref:P1 family peptidase n=1 Tax=Paenibacillus larvae TaxID=1464 RepID=UPI0026BDF061